MSKKLVEEYQNYDPRISAWLKETGKNKLYEQVLVYRTNEIIKEKIEPEMSLIELQNKLKKVKNPPQFVKEFMKIPEKKTIKILSYTDKFKAYDPIIEVWIKQLQEFKENDVFKEVLHIKINEIIKPYGYRIPKKYNLKDVLVYLDYRKRMPCFVFDFYNEHIFFYKLLTPFSIEEAHEKLALIEKLFSKFHPGNYHYIIEFLEEFSKQKIRANQVQFLFYKIFRFQLNGILLKYGYSIREDIIYLRNSERERLLYELYTLSCDYNYFDMDELPFFVQDFMISK